MFFQSVSWYWIAAPLAVAVVGVLLLLRGLGHVFGGRGGKGTAHLAVGAPLSAIGFAIAVLALNTQTFARLSHENDVANVAVKSLDPAQNTWRITIQRLDVPNTIQTCDIQGDSWEMSARVQKWKPWANVLGLDTTYTLDQATNRYFNAGRANGRPITACDLKGPPPASINMCRILAHLAGRGILHRAAPFRLRRLYAERRRRGVQAGDDPVRPQRRTAQRRRQSGERGEALRRCAGAQPELPGYYRTCFGTFIDGGWVHHDVEDRAVVGLDSCPPEFPTKRIGALFCLQNSSREIGVRRGMLCIIFHRPARLLKKHSRRYKIVRCKLNLPVFLILHVIGSSSANTWGS